MQSVTVFVFLLDSLPGFENMLNLTLQETTERYIDVSQCEPRHDESLWNDINKNNVINLDELGDDDIAQNLIETTHNEVDNDVRDEKVYRDFLTDNETSADISNNTFLVSIFETVLNTTAQTCGGTLVSPYWVLTAATCVDLLSRLYKKNLKVFQTHYSVIANANNPLTEGTVHNVSEIILNPTSHSFLSGIFTNISHSDSKSNIKIPSLALLKIEPPVNNHIINIVLEKINPGIEVGVYGWLLNKDSTSGHDILSVATFQAITTESNNCKINYSFIDETSLICLFPRDENDDIRMINSGGPVVLSFGNRTSMAAVAQLDSQSNVAAFLLHPYYSWIKEVIS